MSVENEDLFLVLAGGNQVSHGQVSGLISDMVIGFPGLRKDLRVLTYDFSREKVFPLYPQAPDVIKTIRRATISLKELESDLGDTKLKLTRPVEVYVLAKRKVSIIAKNDKALFMGSVYVGDETGICELIMFNDAIESVFKCISQGDRILINAGCINHRLITESHFTSIYNPEMILLMEIKVNVFDARKIYVVKDVTQSKEKSFQNVISSVQIVKKLWTATDVLHADNDALFKKNLEVFEKRKKTQFDFETEKGDKPINNFDVIGVIKHAGRLERQAKWKYPKIMSFKPNIDPSEQDPCHPITHYNRNFQQYSVFRWLELIDLLKPEGEPVRVQIHMNDVKMWRSQRKLIPGSLILITHCTPRLTFLGKSIGSTNYSELYSSTDEISLYFKRMPQSFLEGKKDYFVSSTWRNLFALKRLKFTIGGAYCQRIRNEKLFEKCQPKNDDHELINTLPYPQLPFLTHEVQRIVFNGRITENLDKNSFHKVPYCAVSGDSEVKIGPIFTHSSFLRWTGRRGLPELSVEKLVTSKEIMLEVSKQYGPFSECLCDMFKQNIPHPKIRSELDLAELIEYYYLKIESELYGWVYYACWFGSRNSKEQMKNQLKAAEGKKVEVMIDIQKIFACRDGPSLSQDEPHHEYEYEAIVHDFKVIG